MKRENDAYDKALEALIKEAAIKADEHLGAEIPDPDEEIVFSQEHQKKMKKMFRRERCRQNAKIASKWAARCACLAAFAVFIAGMNGYGIVGAWKAQFINFVYNRDAINSQYSFEDGEMPEESEFSKFFIEYVPEGFEKTEYIQDDYHLFVCYENQEKYFCYGVERVGGMGEIDTQDAIVEEIEINGCKGISSVKEKYQILLWADTTYIYDVYGNIGKEELMKIGKSIKKSEN